MIPVILCAGFVCIASAADVPTFDRATISRDRSGRGRVQILIQFQPGPAKVTMRNVSLRQCMEQAYHVNDYQVSGPGWTKSVHYDVEATMSRSASPDEIRTALQALFAERLQLAVRLEQRDASIYVLTVASVGPKLRPATNLRPMPAPPPGGERLSRELHLNNASVEQFCEELSRRLDRPVVDRTGLPGAFDFDLTYGDSRNLVGPTVFKAVEHQLGLKLIDGKAPVEHLTIERALKKPLSADQP